MATKSKSPVFPMPEPHHFSDYGFDPQFDYFQVLEEAKRYKQRESTTDTFHFTINNNNNNSSAKNHRRRWWKTALYFFKFRWAHPSSTTSTTKPVVRPTSISGPIYITDSLSGSSTPFRHSSGPLTPAGKGTPYFSLRELNMDQQPHMISPLPIYLVT